MSWDPVWEQIFRERAHWGRYPPEELIRFMARYYYDAADRRAVRVLEVGCGPGAGPGWYVAREGFSYFGIDGSATAIDKARWRFAEEQLQVELRIGAAEALPWGDGVFDCVIDIACLQHNAEAGARAIIAQIHRVLARGGRHFSMTTRPGCWGETSGIRVDRASLSNLSEGPFAHMGVVRFSTAEQLRELYAAFCELDLDYSIRSIDAGRHEVANWIVTCRK